MLAESSRFTIPEGVSDAWSVLAWTRSYIERRRHPLRQA